MDGEVTKELQKICSEGSNEEVFPEHEFVASCLRIGLSISDLKQMKYTDAMKILLAYIGFPKGNNTKRATQEDIDRLLG